jgi:hypothetical protein
VLVVAGTKKLLEDALEQREADDRLDEETFEEGLEDLPQDALIKVYGNLEALLKADADTRQARKVEWVKALRTFGLTTTVEEDEIAIDFNLATDSGDLSEDEVPLASGRDAPGVVQREGEIGIGVRDLNHIFQFGQRAAQAVDPGQFGQFEAAKRQIESRLGVSVDDDVFGQLEGDVSVSVNVSGGFAARAELKDPAKFRRTLKKVSKVLPDVAESIADRPVRLTEPKGRDGFYELTDSAGETVVFGVVGDALVASNDAARARRLASEEPKAVPGAEGSVAFNVNAEALLDRILARLGGITGLSGALFTGPLGDLSGSVESSTEGLRGRLKLEID